MSVIFQIINIRKFPCIKKTLKYSSAHRKCLFTRSYSGSPKKFITFDEIGAQRRDEARRSLVIQVNSKSSFNELHSYCSKYADVEGVHHYRNKGGENFMLIEFKTEANVQDVYKECGIHQNEQDTMATPTPFLWFRAAQNKKEKIITPLNVSLKTLDATSLVNNDNLIDELIQCNDVSQQMKVLYDKTKLNDIGVRLRYMVAMQLEMVFSSLYSNIVVKPFGSSVNCFGKIGCDLDLVFTHKIDDKADSNRRLVFQQRNGNNCDVLHQLEVLAPALENRVSGVGRVIRILHARVPILKFSHLYADLDCDLCYNNMSGVYMSELLYLYSTLDGRTAPLVFAVKRWASGRGLTSPHPGRWITGFPLSLMVLFFLQTCKVLPSLNALIKLARKEDIRIAEENINCTYLRDLNVLPQEMLTKNKSSLESLLLQFFEFYSQFDFKEKAISINDGAPVRKPNNQPLYIINPLNTGLNVSKNVSFSECERLKVEVRNGAWQLEAENDSGKQEIWGLLGLAENKSDLSLRKLVKVGNSHRLLSLKDLFKENAEVEIGKKPQKLTDVNIEEFKDTKEVQKEQKIRFKNPQVKSEVLRIRRNKMA